jgi:hypothetical protein
MFFTDSTETTRNHFGNCPFEGDLLPHANVLDYTSSNYGFYYNATGTDWQEGWYWCSNCQGMFWANGHAQNGTQQVGPVCPVNGGLNSRTGAYTPHDDTGSSSYYIPSSGYLDLGPPIMV